VATFILFVYMKVFDYRDIVKGGWTPLRRNAKHTV